MKYFAYLIGDSSLRLTFASSGLALFKLFCTPGIMTTFHEKFGNKIGITFGELAVARFLIAPNLRQLRFGFIRNDTVYLLMGEGSPVI